MRVFIYACENIYGGLHGMGSAEMTEVDTIEEAEEIGHEMSYDVIYSYHEITKSFEEDAEAEGLDPESDEYAEYMDECVEEDICYEVYLIADDVTLTKQELNDEIYNLGKEEFIKKYCKEVE